MNKMLKVLHLMDSRVDNVLIKFAPKLNSFFILQICALIISDCNREKSVESVNIKTLQK